MQMYIIPYLEFIAINAENLDVNNCLVGPSGERVCPLGAFGADGQSRVQFRGNKVIKLVIF